MGELSRLEAAGGHWRRANLYALSAQRQSSARQQRILLHPTRHHIAQKYMLSVATWRREWAERV